MAQLLKWRALQRKDYSGDLQGVPLKSSAELVEHMCIEEIIDGQAKTTRQDQDE